MFSLIIVLVSIALVIALVAATIYYGGSAAKTGAAKASATTLVNQASQIAAAGTLTVAQGGSWPATASGPIFGEPYLKGMPVPPQSAYAGTTPAAADWTYYLPDLPTPAVRSNHFVLKDKINKEVCFAINRQQGFNGIPAAWDGTSMVQCFGTGPRYTFFYDPPGSRADESQAALAKSVADASAQLAGAPVDTVAADDDSSTAVTPVATAAPGYPRLCYSGRVIQSGSCIDSVGAGSGGVVAGGGTPEAVPPSKSGAAFVSDSFSGTDGTLIMAHAPEIGGNWIRPYEIAYGATDCNFRLTSGALEPSDYSCWGDDQLVLNEAAPPSADYEVSADFTFKRDDSYAEIYLLGRASLGDSMRGYLYLDKSGGAVAQISAYSEGNAGAINLYLPLTVGTHKFRMVMAGSNFQLYYDGVLVHERSVSVLSQPGMAGFAIHHNDDPDYLAIDNFLAK